MLELARSGVIHVLGSDSHSSRIGRPVAMRQAFAVLSGVEDLAPHLDWMAQTAPQAIVAGEELTLPF